MHLDVLDLRAFYYRTQLGRAAQRAIRDQMQDSPRDVAAARKPDDTEWLVRQCLIDERHHRT